MHYKHMKNVSVDIKLNHDIHLGISLYLELMTLSEKISFL